MSFYRVGDKVRLETFGSVKSVPAVVEETFDNKLGTPKYFRDKNGTLLTHSDVVSFSMAAKTKVYLARCEVITGIVERGGAWEPKEKVYTFKAATGLTDDEIARAAYSAMTKRWKTGRFIKVLS
jgi:hypothetical protein